MTFVLDASVAVGRFIMDAATDASAKIRDRLAIEGSVVPEVFWGEVLNVLMRAERRRRRDGRIFDGQLAALQSFSISTDANTSTYLIERSLPLARRHRLSLFDAAYLERASRLNVELATFDAALLRAAAAESITVLT